MIRNLYETQMSWNLGNIRSMYKRSNTYFRRSTANDSRNFDFGTRIYQFYFFEITSGNEAWSKILRLPRRKSKVATFQERAKSRESFWNYSIEKSERIGREMSRRYRAGGRKMSSFFPGIHYPSRLIKSQQSLRGPLTRFPFLAFHIFRDRDACKLNFLSTFLYESVNEERWNQQVY